jgi:uncharacterized coiled-coil protein SlyX
MADTIHPSPEARAYARTLAAQVVAQKDVINTLRRQLAERDAKLARAHGHIQSLEARLCAARVSTLVGKEHP